MLDACIGCLDVLKISCVYLEVHGADLEVYEASSEYLEVQ